ncbi:MAG TPA: hypothetical protein VG890_15515 [Puia sp.]|nr:hypothetical protein [Puia sp.]
MFDSIVLEFNERRHSVRGRLALSYEEDNEIISLGKGNESIIMRRDVYRGLNSTQFFFFLDYDKDDMLSEIEIHRCEGIEVLSVSFTFDDELDSVALELSKYSEISILSQGEIFFKDLKMVISDKRKMGGEGSTIGYFYCASDVSHIG